MTHSLIPLGSTITPPKRPNAADPENLTDGQIAVLRAFWGFGKPLDDQALAVYVHHIEDDPMSSSSVRSRRAELTRPIFNERGEAVTKPLVAAVDTKRLRSGRRAAVHALTPAGQKVAETLFVL